MSTETPSSSPAPAAPSLSGVAEGLPPTVEPAVPPAAPPVASAAPEPKRRSFLYLASALAGGNLVAHVMRMAGSLLQARLIAPHIQGLFTGLSLIQGYAPLLHLGVLNGLNRELPYYMGKGDRERVDELAAVAQAWALLLGSVTGAGVLVVAAWFFVHGRMWMAAGLATNAALVFFLFYNQWYLQTTYRTGHDFARLAFVTALQWTMALVLVAPIKYLGFYGVCLRALIPVVLATMLLHRWRPLHVRPRWNWTHWKHLLKIGAPIFAVGQLYSWWLLLDGTLVLKLMGTHGLGLYTMTLATFQLITLLPSSVAQVVYPRMAERYGHTERLEDALRLAIKPVAVTFLGMGLLVPIGWFLARPFVSTITPKYVDGVSSMQWSLLIGVILAFAPITNAFNVVRKQGLLTVATIAGMAVYLAALAILMHNGRYLSAFPQAMMIGQGVYVLLSYVFLAGLLQKERAAQRA